MREIAYRAYLKNEKQIVDVLDISFLQETIGYMNKADTKYTCAKFNDIELLPYTGLEDKNGKKIFEGDILQIDDVGKAVVVFGSYPIYQSETGSKYFCQCFACEWEDGSGYSALREEECLRFNEVIGNIWDNPELLEVGK